MAPAVFELELDRGGLDYRCGDCTLLIRDDKVDSRPYSFSSHPDEPALRFLFRRIETPGGARTSFSTWLSLRRPGDEVGVGTPFGWFRPAGGPHEVWLATGTGLAPFLSALRAAAARPPRQLLIGIRRPEDAVLRDWLAARAPVTWALSQPAAGQGPPRRVTHLAEEVPIATEISYFLCGNAGMIRDVKAVLQRRGAEASQIHEEAFT